MSIPHSSACSWVLPMLWCMESSDFYTTPAWNFLIWSVPKNRVYRQGGHQWTTLWESTLPGPQTLCQNVWHSSQWHNRDSNLAPAVGASVCRNGAWRVRQPGLHGRLLQSWWGWGNLHIQPRSEDLPAYTWSLGQEDTLEEGMATHSSILAWRIPWTGEPGGLQSMGLQRIRQDWSDLACTHLSIWPKLNRPDLFSVMGEGMKKGNLKLGKRIFQTGTLVARPLLPS